MSWQQRLLRIIEADTDDLVGLARIAGCDPVDFYRTASFAGLPIRASEITALDLRPDQLDGADIIGDEVDDAIDGLACDLFIQLASSGNFAQTHDIVAKLLRLSPFTGRGIDLYMDAVEANEQVSWIMRDLDLVQLAAQVDASPAARHSSSRFDRLKHIRETFGPM